MADNHKSNVESVMIKRGTSRTIVDVAATYKERTVSSKSQAMMIESASGEVNSVRSKKQGVP